MAESVLIEITNRADGDLLRLHRAVAAVGVIGDLHVPLPDRVEGRIGALGDIGSVGERCIRRCTARIPADEGVALAGEFIFIQCK